jgi:hypothetical protein
LTITAQTQGYHDITNHDNHDTMIMQNKGSHLNSKFVGQSRMKVNRRAFPLPAPMGVEDMIHHFWHPCPFHPVGAEFLAAIINLLELDGG